MHSQAIASRLLARGKALFDNPPPELTFAPNVRAEIMGGRLEPSPHTLIIACLFDYQDDTGRADTSPLALRHRLGGDFSMPALLRLTRGDIRRATSEPTKLHRFPRKTAEFIYCAIQMISDRYAGDASRIWSERPPSAMLIHRLKQFKGIKQKLANMIAAILVRDFRVELSDHRDIDIALDTHTRRVLPRLGLVAQGAKDAELVAFGRQMSPEYPGLLDLPLWEIGKLWCHASRAPECRRCYMASVCPTAAAQGIA